MRLWRILRLQQLNRQKFCSSQKDTKNKVGWANAHPTLFLGFSNSTVNFYCNELIALKMPHNPAFLSSPKE